MLFCDECVGVCKKDAPYSPLHCLFLFWCTVLSLGRVSCRLNSFSNCIWLQLFFFRPSFHLRSASLCLSTVHWTKGTTCTALFSALFLFWCTALILVREGSASAINFPSMCSHEEKHKHNPFSLFWWKDHYEIASELCGDVYTIQFQTPPTFQLAKVKSAICMKYLRTTLSFFFCSFLVFIC